MVALQNDDVLETAKPVALDFFCGRGGWTRGFLDAGFDVRGFDVDPQPDYPGRFEQADVRNIDPRDYRGAPLAVFSPPCQGFSLVNPQVHKGERPNDLDLELAMWPKRFVEVARPRWWVVENVRGAVKHFEPIYGRPVLRYGSFYLWGRIPPFLVERSNARMKYGGNRFTTNGRKKVPYKDPALTSMVPLELSRPLGRAAMVELLVAERGVVA